MKKNLMWALACLASHCTIALAGSPEGTSPHCFAVATTAGIPVSGERLVQQGTVLFTVSDGALTSIDASDPFSPVVLDTLGSDLQSSTLVVDGDYAYCRDATAHIQIIDISNPTGMSVSGSYDLLTLINGIGFLTGFDVQGSTMYFTYNQISPQFVHRLATVDASAPASPTLIAENTAPVDHSFTGLRVNGSYTYCVRV